MQPIGLASWRGLGEAVCYRGQHMWGPSRPIDRSMESSSINDRIRSSKGTVSLYVAGQIACCLGGADLSNHPDGVEPLHYVR